MELSRSPLADDTFDRPLRLDELVDRPALDELIRSVYALFGIPVRVFGEDGTILAEASSQQEICAYVATSIPGRAACASTVSAVKARDLGDSEEIDHPCFTGACYRIVALEYDGRRIGRLVIGPYLPHTVAEPPSSLERVDASFRPEKTHSLLFKMPRVKPDTVGRIAKHLKTTLALIFFSGHKTMLTTQLHLASVKESYRELQEKAAKLQDAYDRLKELDRLKSNFLATVSHELRTPLTSIIGYSEMLTEGIAGEMTGEQREFVQTIHEKGEQLLALIMSLLDLSKLESGTMAMRRRVIALRSVLDEVVSTVLPTARKKNVEVRIDAPADLSRLRADPERLRQVFLNLVDNSLKFTPPGGLVLIRARESEMAASSDAEEMGFALLAPVRRSLEVRVEDSGIGVPESERARIFDAFYQVDSSSTREHGGAGLGLAIVRRIVEAHSGTIRVEGNTPHGTVFVVNLPSDDAGANGGS